jgi:hypothetical protein
MRYIIIIYLYTLPFRFASREPRGDAGEDSGERQQLALGRAVRSVKKRNNLTQQQLWVSRTSMGGWGDGVRDFFVDS